VTVAIKSKELARVLRNASLFLGEDTRPVLQTCRVEIEKDALYLQTTDSYAVIRERVDCTDVNPADVGAVGYIPLKDAKPMLAMLKADGGQTVLDFSDTGQSETVITVKILTTGASFECRGFGSFPDIDQLIKPLTFDGLAKGPTLGFGLWQLARLAKIEASDGRSAKDHSFPARLETTEGVYRPVRFAIADILVYVMPVRLP